MDPDLDRLERDLARQVSLYLETRQASMHDTLNSLLSWHWHARGLSRYRWFDGVDHPILNILERNQLEILGIATCGDTGDGAQWIEMFGADLRLGPGREELEDYNLRIGRKGFEDHRIPYDEMGRAMKELLQGARWDWAYVFTRQDARG